MPTVEGAPPTIAPQSNNTGGGGSVQADFDAISFSFGASIASSWTAEIIPQGLGSQPGAGPVDHTDPEHIVFSLDNYALPETCCNPLNQPRIYVYPADQMSAQNPFAAPRIADLRTYLSNPPADLMDQSEAIPFLPLFNAAQVYHTQVQFVDFQNGKGVRYLTQYAQSPMPVNNASIFYTFQGLTTDGAYYVAVTMPVTHPSLSAHPEDAATTEGDAFMTDAVNYINEKTQQLDAQSPNSFTPDLAALDAMLQSMLVRP